MKTIQWLKKSLLFHGIFIFCCISFMLCVAAHRYLEIEVPSILSTILAYGWTVNPTGLFAVVRGFALYFSERGQERDRRIIGKKWLWFIAFLLIETFLYLIAIVWIVLLTGGV